MSAENGMVLPSTKLTFRSVQSFPLAPKQKASHPVLWWTWSQGEQQHGVIREANGLFGKYRIILSLIGETGVKNCLYWPSTLKGKEDPGT